jgi:hypothetical protein
MKLFLMVAALVGGVFLAVKATAWANYFTFGENRERREKEKRDKALQ